MTSPTPGPQGNTPPSIPGHSACSATNRNQTDARIWANQGLKSAERKLRIGPELPNVSATSFRHPCKGAPSPPPLRPLTKGFGDISWTRAASILQKGKSKERLSVGAWPAIPLPWGHSMASAGPAPSSHPCLQPSTQPSGPRPDTPLTTAPSGPQAPSVLSQVCTLTACPPPHPEPGHRHPSWDAEAGTAERAGRRGWTSSSASPCSTRLATGQPRNHHSVVIFPPLPGVK